MIEDSDSQGKDIQDKEDVEDKEDAPQVDDPQEDDPQEDEKDTKTEEDDHSWEDDDDFPDNTEGLAGYHIRRRRVRDTDHIEYDRETAHQLMEYMHPTVNKMTNLKDIAAAWLLEIIEHKYTRKMRVDIDLFIIKGTIQISKFQTLADNLDNII